MSSCEPATLSPAAVGTSTRDGGLGGTLGPGATPRCRPHAPASHVVIDATRTRTRCLHGPPQAHAKRGQQASPRACDLETPNTSLSPESQGTPLASDQDGCLSSLSEGAPPEPPEAPGSSVIGCLMPQGISGQKTGSLVYSLFQQKCHFSIVPEL